MNHLKKIIFDNLSKDIIEKNYQVNGSKLLKDSLDPTSEKMIVTLAKEKTSRMIVISIENEEGTSYSFPINEDFIKEINKMNKKWTKEISK